jgi:two-component sensor histidine kinase
MDRRPRSFTAEETACLETLAGLAMDALELKSAAGAAQAELSAALAEKEAVMQRADIMAKEIDHRVMNSLQLISGLLRLHSRDLGEGEAADQIAIAATRVAAIAKAHQHIYLTDGIERAECTAYLQRLCDDLSLMLSESGRGEIRLHGVDLVLPTSQLVAIGLIVNELVTGAVKRGAVSVHISLTQSLSGGYELCLRPKGGSVAAVVDAGTGDRLGPKVVASLLDQIGGELTPQPGDGSVTICFPGETTST